MVSSIFTKTKIYILLLIICSLIIGFFAIKTLSFISPTPEGDAIEFDMTAISLVEKNSYDMSFQYIRAPGYSFFLAFVYKIFGHNYTLIYWLQFLLLGISGAIAFYICNKFLNLNHFFSLLPALTIIIWPYFILHAKLLLVEILYSFLLLCFTYLLLVFVKNPEFKKSILPGFALGLAVLTRPVPLLLPLWLIFAMLFYFLIKNIINKNKKYIITKKIFLSAILAFFIFLLTLIPWITYASYKAKKFVPIASTFSDVYKGSNKSFINEWSYYKTPGYEPGSEVTLKKILTIKIKNVFRFWKSGANGYQADALVKKYPLIKYAIFFYEITFYLILLLALLAIINIFKKTDIFLLWMIVSYNWLFHATLHTQPRYNLPTIPLTIMLAFYTLNEIIKYNKFYKIKNVKNPQTKTL